MILEFFKKLAIKRRESIKKATEQKIVYDGETLFQVCEHKDELWFTYDNNLVCPMRFFKEDPVQTLKYMRVLYAENKHDGY